MDGCVPFFDLRRRHHPHRNAMVDRLEGIVTGGAYFDGPEVAELERELREWLRLPNCVAVGSGLTAIEMALNLLGIECGDEIITPALTSPIVAQTIARSGATLKFADVDPVTFQLCPQSTAAAINPRTRGLYVPNFFGVPCLGNALDALCQRAGIPWIDDATEGLGASLNQLVCECLTRTPLGRL